MGENAANDKQYLQHPRNNADSFAGLIFRASAAHGKRFPAAGLTVGEYRGIVA
jgi:hypothetical protein